MMQSELLHQPSWQFYSTMDSTLDEVGLYSLNMDDAQMGGCDFSSSFISNEDSGIFLESCFQSMISSDFSEFPVEALQEVSPVDEIFADMERFDHDLSGEFEGVCLMLDESEGSFPSEQLSMEGVNDWSPCQSTNSSNITSSTQTSLTLPGEEMEINNQLIIHHLLKAYGEAMEKEQKELAEVIVRCISEKSSAIGDAIERLAFFMFQENENDGEYLKQESIKNFETAFKTFYQIFPYGRFAHFAANSAILEAVPAETDTIHIVDFDMGEGIQWPPMLEAVQRQQKAMKLTSIKWGEDYSSAPQGRFEETKRLLCDHARCIGLKLTIEEMEIESLVSEIKRRKKRGGRKEWLAFNCMVGLPHMGRWRSRKNVEEFLRVGKDLIAEPANCSTRENGIITFGDGEEGEKLIHCSGYGSFFDGNLAHYQTLFESMEKNFPSHLVEARMTMECLFLSPYVSPVALTRKWEEMKEGSDFNTRIEMDGWRFSKDILMEAKLMVRERQSSYGVRVEGQQGNQMVLEWRGTPLVKVSTWR